MSIAIENVPQQANRVKLYLGGRTMGEVRATIRLTNAFDAMSCDRGLISEDAVRQIEVDAMIDTGAVQTVIPLELMEELGIRIKSQRFVTLADGRMAEVPVTEGVFVEVMGRDTFEECVVLGNEVLIGQTILEKTDLLVDCARARLVSNPAHPDGPVFRV